MYKKVEEYLYRKESIKLFSKYKDETHLQIE